MKPYWLGGLLCLASLAPATAALPFTPAAVPGGIAAVPLPATPHTPRVRYNDAKVMVRRFDGQTYAIVGIPLSAQAGKAELRVDGKPLSFSIAPKTYREQRITLKNQRQVDPNPEDRARIAREKSLMDPAWVSEAGAAEPNLAFRQPTDGKLSSSFGSRRIFNGQARAPHSGLDIAAPEGASVRAPADGVVVLTGDFFFNGQSVYLAHGQGLVSMMCHLSELSVRDGQRVRAGDLLGRVGQTGRATGPHLHWSVSLNNARVDPALLLPSTKP